MRECNQFIQKMQPRPSEELVDVAREMCGNKLLLGISGKDSLAAWLFLREYGFEIYPFAYYAVPGISYFDESIAYYEDFFSTKILTLPMPDFYQQLSRCYFQPPDRIALLRAMRLPNYKEYEYEDAIAAYYGLGDNYLSAIGYRAADSAGRMSFIRRNGPIGTKDRHYYFAIWDWKTKQVMGKIEDYGVKLSRAYEIMGCTGDIFGAADLRALYHGSRKDYDLIRWWYPLIGLQPVRWFYVK